MRAKTKNSLHLAALLLQDRRLQIQARIVLYTLRPLRLEHEETIRKQRTVEGTLEYHAGVAAESWLETMHSTLAVLSNRDVLKRLALDHTGDVCDEDAETAQTLFRAVFEVLAQRCLSMTVFSTLPPWILAGLLHSEAAARAAILEQLKDNLSNLRAACRAAAGEDTTLKQNVAALLEDLHVHRWPSVAQLLTLLEAEGWQVTGPVRRTLLRVFGGKGNTKTNLEDCFNKLRDTERATKNRRMSRLARYFTAAAHAAATEGEHTVRITAEEWSAPPRIQVPPSKIRGGLFQPHPFKRVGKDGAAGAGRDESQPRTRFVGGGLHSSIDLQALFSGRRSNVGTSGPVADHRATAAWECIQLLAPQEFKGLESVWATVALLPQHLYRIRCDQDGTEYETFIVLAFRTWGVLTWPAREMVSSRDGHTYFRLCSKAAPEWRVLRPETIDALTQIIGRTATPCAIPSRVVAPGAVPEDLRAWGVLLVQDGPPVAVLPYAVQHAGRDLLLKHLKGFCAGLGLRLPSGAAQSKAAYLKLLIGHLFSDWEPAERTELLRRHTSSARAEPVDEDLLQAVELLEPAERPTP
jgi:hypothetical protein